MSNQYTSVYGIFCPGDYALNDEIPGMGQVIWSYLSPKGLTYVCTGDGFPEEILASEVVAE